MGTEVGEVMSCVAMNDPAGIGQCHTCMEAGTRGIDYEKDVCAQLQQRADEQWCVDAEECAAGCRNTMTGTWSACESDWNAALACLGMTAQDLEDAMTGVHCPGVCPDIFGDVSVTALN